MKIQIKTRKQWSSSRGGVETVALLNWENTPIRISDGNTVSGIAVVTVGCKDQPTMQGNNALWGLLKRLPSLSADFGADSIGVAVETDTHLTEAERAALDTIVSVAYCPKRRPLTYRERQERLKNGHVNP